MRKRAWKKTTAVITAVALVLTGVAVPHDTAAAAKMKLNKKKVTLKVGKKVKLKLKNAKKKVTWKSSNKKVASVNKKGLVKGKKPGKAKITAKCQGKKFVCKVTVKRNGTSLDDSMDVVTSGTPAARVTAYPVPTSVPARTGRPAASPGTTPTGKPLAPNASPAASAGAQVTPAPGAKETDKPGIQETSAPLASDSADPGVVTTDKPDGVTASDKPDITKPSGTPDGNVAGATPSADVSTAPDATADPTTPGTTADPTTPGTTADPATPGTTADPAATAQPGSTILPTATALPTPTGKPSEDEDDDAFDSVPIKPDTAEADTLAIGQFNIRLGMTREEVEAVMGDEPDYSGTSPQGMETCMYNPSGDYMNLIEMQFKDGKVAEISTISAYFRYADLASSGDTAQTLKDNGFKTMRSYDYEAGYLYSGENAYVMAFVDHQMDEGVYAVQIFDKTLSSKVDNLIKPQYCTYDDDIAETMQMEMEDFVNAFRVCKGLDPMDQIESESDTAQTQAEYMASVGMNTTRDESGRDFGKRFKEEYDDPYMKTEFTGDSCEDAFSYVVYAVDDTDNILSGEKLSNIYKYMIMEEGYDGESVEMNYACGFYYNMNKKERTYGVIDIIGN